MYQDGRHSVNHKRALQRCTIKDRHLQRGGDGNGGSVFAGLILVNLRSLISAKACIQAS